MVDLRTGLRGAAWLFYAIFVLEILFMISPAALYLYSIYGPAHGRAAPPSRRER